MTTAAVRTDCLCRAIEFDFTSTRSQLSEARGRLRLKDSPSNRASVAECWTRIDALLDLLLEVCRTRG